MADQHGAAANTPRAQKAGGGLFVPSGTMQAATNIGSGNGVEFATSVVEEDKPLVVMVK